MKRRLYTKVFLNGVVAVGLCLLFSAEHVYGGEMRSWTSSVGTKMQAMFVERDGDVVTLEKDDGKILRLQMNQLSVDDQMYVAKMKASGVGDKAVQKAEAPVVIKDMFGSELVDARRKKISVNELGGKTIGILFSAHWCPPCRTFTPELIEVYNFWKSEKEDFEVVFVSSDRSKEDMFDYMKKKNMPWLALPYDSGKKKELSERYKVRGIPTLVIIDAEGNTITDGGRGDVYSHKKEALSHWKSQASQKSGK